MTDAQWMLALFLGIALFVILSFVVTVVRSRRAQQPGLRHLTDRIPAGSVADVEHQRAANSHTLH